MHRDSNAPQKSTSAESATNMATFPVYATKRRLRCITRTVTETPKCNITMQVQCVHKIVPITVILSSQALMNPFALSCRCKAIKLEGKQIPNLVHLITNLAYHLKLHHTGNMYLRACLDTCVDMNIILASVY